MALVSVPVKIARLIKHIRALCACDSHHTGFLFPATFSQVIAHRVIRGKVEMTDSAEMPRHANDFEVILKRNKNYY